MRLPAFLLFFLCFSCTAYAQAEHPESTVNGMPAPADTTQPIIDTVHHVVFTRQDSMKAERVVRTPEDLAQAENTKRWIKAQVQALAFYRMHGRGYVKGGRDSAAKYVLKKFGELKLQPVGRGDRYTQGFSFPVNTFPGRMYLRIDKDSLAPGFDFIIDPASPSFSGEGMRINEIDLAGMSDSVWKSTVASFDAQHLYCFYNVDSLCGNVLHIRTSQFASVLPRGAYVIPQSSKLIWSVSRDTIAATVFYVDKDALPKNLKKATVYVDAVFLQHAHSDNIIGCVPGEVKDSFIVFTAHYDHLGMMGDTTYFPGASDNASGVGVMLYLASYFARHPQHYTVVFIAFAGEEAALMGSEFFVGRPMFPLKKIKFLTNLDIMGDATDGITVVNATLFPKQFALLNQVNDKNVFLPEIRSRGPAANSDQYYFTEAGVPCFFMYSNGGKGYYHDVYDRAREVTLNHIDDVVQLLIDFVKELN